MAIKRIWFPNIPSSGISVSDRSQEAVGIPLGQDSTTPTPISIDETYLRRYLNDVGISGA